MSENNLPNMDENVEEMENQAAEEVVEEVAEEMEEAADFADEAAEEPAEETVIYADDLDVEVPAAKSGKAGAVIGIVVALVVIIAGLLVWYVNKPLPVPEELDMGSQTMGEIAESMETTVADLVDTWDLPGDVTEETSWTQVQNLMPLKQMATMNQMGVQALKNQLAIPDEITGEENILDKILGVFGISRYKITENTPFGLAKGEITLGNYIREGYLDAFKEEYGLGDEVTADTKWKEVRDIVAAKDKEEYEAQNAAVEETAEDADAEVTDDAAETVTADEATAE